MVVLIHIVYVFLGNVEHKLDPGVELKLVVEDRVVGSVFSRLIESPRPY